MRSIRGHVRLVAAGALVAGGLSTAAATPPTAQADYVPPAGTPATVTGDALPTVQVDGVVWQQAIVGNTVYAVGNFSNARPAGAAVGKSQTPRTNILAYNLTTGALITTFNHKLNGQALSVAASPDGSRLYIGGDFTAVDDQPRAHVAAFDLPSGALSSTFAPTVHGKVHAITASASTIYVGGSFTEASATSVGNLVAYTPAGVKTAWQPRTDQPVRSMVLAAGNGRLIIGGHFKTVNGVRRLGLAAVDVETGATINPWNTAKKLFASGSGSWVSSLTTDGTKIYGTAVTYSGGDTQGNFEGSFAVSPANGDLLIANDCHGDSYDNAAVGGVLYVVSHAHDCSAMGGFPEYHPLAQWSRAMAFTTDARGVNSGPDSYGWNYNGEPASEILHWFPNVDSGTFTGQHQGAWSLESASGYVVMGGEFPTVNGTRQQGLVRFATAASAPKKVGPVRQLMGKADVKALPGGAHRVTWTSTWDRDNERLRHEVLRDGVVVHTVSADSVFWDRPTLSFVDQPPAGNHTYQIRTSDPSGNSASTGPDTSPDPVPNTGPDGAPNQQQGRP